MKASANLEAVFYMKYVILHSLSYNVCSCLCGGVCVCAFLESHVHSYAWACGAIGVKGQGQLHHSDKPPVSADSVHASGA